MSKVASIVFSCLAVALLAATVMVLPNQRLEFDSRQELPVNEPSPALSPAEEAREDLAAGHLRLRTGIFAGSWAFEQVLREEHGIEVEAVLACITSDEARLAASEYNAVMREAIAARCGEQYLKHARWRAAEMQVVLRTNPTGTPTYLAQDELPARDILNQIARAYAECDSYSDWGIVSQAIGDGRTKVLVFNTAFVRPDQFRFEFVEYDDPDAVPYIVWSNGDDVRTSWFTGIKNPQSLGIGVARATGVSLGAAHRVPSLFMPEEVRGRQLTEMTNLRREQDEFLLETECYRIRGEYGSWPTTLWIDKQCMTLLKITQHRPKRQTTWYYPTLNEDVAADHLAFNPHLDEN